MGILNIDFLGSTFSLNAEEDDAYLNQIYEYFKDVCAQIKKNDKIEDEKKIAILAGILISDQFFQARKKIQEQENRSDQEEADNTLGIAPELLTKMIEKIDGVLFE